MEQNQQNKHITLIDDDPVTNMINEKIIGRNSNFNITSYTNGQVALDQFSGSPGSPSPQLPDVIFLDINMPQMDGWQFLTEFQKFPVWALDKCRVFMLTSSIDLDDVEKSKAFTFVRDFISKPLTSQKLEMLTAA